MKKILSILATILTAVCCGPEIDPVPPVEDPEPEPEKTTISVDRNELSFEAEESSHTLKVTSTGEWSASATETWCTLTPEKGSAGTTDVTVKVAANVTENDRECTIRFNCPDEEVTVKVVQQKLPPVEDSAPYVDLKFADTDNVTLTSFDENSGSVTVTYSDPSIMPKVARNKVIILPESEQYQNPIRIVTESSASGNTLTLNTIPGTMSNLFENVEFALATNPSMTPDESLVQTRSGGPLKIYTPEKMVLKVKDGRDIVLMDKNNPTKTTISDRFDLFNFSKSYDGHKIFDNSYGTLFWEECNFNFLIDTFIYFAYGDNYLSVDNIWGFQYYIEGNLDINLLLKYIIEREFDIVDIDDIVVNNALNLETTFSVGGVPINVAIMVDIRSYLNISATGTLTATAGFSYNYNFGRIGMNWYQGSDPTQILKMGGPSYTLHEPTLNVQGGLEAWGGFYPHIYVQFYKLAGPWASLLPYLNFEAEAGMQKTASGNDEYMGWTMDFGAGMAYNLGLDWAFRSPGKDPWSPYDEPQQIDNLYTNLFKAPVKVELVSPSASAELSVGRPVDVEFRVSSESPLFPEDDFNCPGAALLFKSESGGELSENQVITDKNGIGKVTWTPKDAKDKLTARIVDKDGEEIHSVEFAPKVNAFRVKLLSHKDGDLIEADLPVKVQFQVDSVKADDTFAPAEGIKVDFSNETSQVSDKTGIVEVEWIPTEEAPRLTASINMESACLSADTFTPELTHTEISLKSPQDGYQIKAGESVDVSFSVLYSSAEVSEVPCKDRSIIFEDGTQWSETVQTDAEGTAEITWTPQGSTPVLTATLLNEAGEPMKSATFTPIIIMNRIALVSPEDSKELVEGEEVLVTFRVYSHPIDTPVSGASVSFTQTGDDALSSKSGVTDANGYITVKWTPSKDAVLTATLDENGETATYTPKFKEPTLVGLWHCFAYKEEGESWYVVPENMKGMLWIRFGEDGGAWSTGYNSPDPDESWYESGIAWRVENSTILLTGRNGAEYAYTNIIYFDGITLEIGAGDGEYFRFNKVEEEDTE